MARITSVLARMARIASVLARMARLYPFTAVWPVLPRLLRYGP